jgi:hypothetical protein
MRLNSCLSRQVFQRDSSSERASERVIFHWAKQAGMLRQYVDLLLPFFSTHPTLPMPCLLAQSRRSSLKAGKMSNHEITFSTSRNRRELGPIYLQDHPNGNFDCGYRPALALGNRGYLAKDRILAPRLVHFGLPRRVELQAHDLEQILR